MGNGQIHFIIFVSPVVYSMVSSFLQSFQGCINILAECLGLLQGRDYLKVQAQRWEDSGIVQGSAVVGLAKHMV